MPDSREGYVKLGFEVDQASINQIKAANDTLITSLERVGGAAVKTSETFDRLKQVSATIGRATDIDTIGKQFASLGKTIGDDTAALVQMRQVLKEIGASSSEVDKATRAFKEMQAASADSFSGVGGLRRTGGALRQLGLQGPGEAVGKLGDIQEVVKEFGRLGDAMKTLPGLLGNVATEGAALGGSLGAVAAVAGPLALAVGAVAIAYQKFGEGIDASKKALDEAVSSVKAYYTAIEKGTTESLQQQLDATKKRQKDEQEQLAVLEHARAVGFDEAQKQYGDAIARLAFSVGEGRGAFKSVDDQIEALKKSTVETAGQISGLERALSSSAVAANDAAEAEKTLAAERLKAIEKEISAEQQTAQLKRGGTSTQVQDRIKALQDEADAINKNLPALEDEAKKSKEAAAELQKYKDRLAEISKQQKELNDDVLPYIKAKEEEKSFYAQATKDSEQYIKNQQKYADLAATESSEGLKKRVEAIEREKKAIQDGLPQLDALGETSEEARKKAEEYRKKLDELNQEETKLTNDIKPLIESREAEAKAVEKQKQQAAIAEKLENDQAAIIQKAADERAAIIQKSEEEQAAIKERTALERIKIEERYGQKLVDLARAAADESAKLLTDLEQKQADLRTTLGRDEAKAGREAADKTYDIQIKAQREERNALQEHLARIQEIRRGDYVQDQKDLLDRNFASIYLRKLDQNKQIQQENIKFGQDEHKRQQTIRDEIQDAERQRQIAHRERLITFAQQQADNNLAYQRQLAAAKVARERELQVAQETYTRELTDLRRKTAQELTDLQVKTARELAARQAAATKELAVRQAAAVKELQLLEKTEAQRLEIIAKYAKKANDLIAKALTATPVKRAGGGYLDAGQPAMVNEPGSSGMESFNGVPLPGQGLFIPAQGGYVNPNGGSVNNSRSVNATFNIQAHDTEGVRREVVGVLRQVMG